jgi:hypothetical protein
MRIGSAFRQTSRSFCLTLGSKADVRSGSGLPLVDTLLELGKTDRHPLGTVEDGLLARFIASIVPHGAVSIRDPVRRVMFLANAVSP